MTFTQNFTAVGNNLGLSAIVALIPILYFFWALAIKRMKGHLAGLSTLLIALAVAVIAYKMPAGMAVMSATQGAVYGFLPIGWIIIASVFLYNITVKTGQFDIIRSSVVSITKDRRLQALLVAFSFSAFLEGTAGFGAPVAISAALLVGLGFDPLKAAGLCLLANTAPVAFAAVGTPIIALEGTTGIPAMELSQMVGRQLPFLSVLIPFYMVLIMAGWKKMKEVFPALLVSGVSFAITQFLSSNFLGPALPDILSAVVSLFSLTLFLKFWKPKSIYDFPAKQNLGDSSAAAAVPEETKKYTGGQIFKAWSPFLILTAVITVWGIPTAKLALTGQYAGSNVILKAVNAIGGLLSFSPAVPLLDNKIIDASGQPVSASYSLQFLVATGTAILIAAIITKFVVRMSWKDWGTTLGETFNELKFPVITICSVVGFAYVANASGMTTTLGMSLAKTGALFPFFSPFLGWFGVFITGSDTSANVLFGGLQKVTATSIGMNPILAVAANTTGAVTGKMISPQSIAVACAAVGLVGKESNIFRFTIKHSVIMLIFLGLLTFAQSHFLAWMIPA